MLNYSTETNVDCIFWEGKYLTLFCLFSYDRDGVLGQYGCRNHHSSSTHSSYNISFIKWTYSWSFLAILRKHLKTGHPVRWWRCNWSSPFFCVLLKYYFNLISFLHKRRKPIGVCLFKPSQNYLVKKMI